MPCQKYSIKRYCLKELQNYILRIIYVCSLFFSGLPNSVFSTFYFGKLAFCLLVFNLFSVSHEFLIRYHSNIYIHCLYKCHLAVSNFVLTLSKLFSIFVKIRFSHVNKNMKNAEQLLNIIKKRLENKILPKFTSTNFKFGVSISLGCMSILFTFLINTVYVMQI